MTESGVKIEIGKKAPAFSLKNQDGKTVKLADFAGRWVVLYFYPKDDTPGCTTQACGVRDHRNDYADSGARVLGVSPDTVTAQRKFADKYGLDFTLLADEDHRIADLYGVWGEKKMYGKTSMGILRSAFLIDGKGKVQEAWYKISPKDTPTKLLEALGG